MAVGDEVGTAVVGVGKGLTSIMVVGGGVSTSVGKIVDDGAAEVSAAMSF